LNTWALEGFCPGEGQKWSFQAVAKKIFYWSKSDEISFYPHENKKTTSFVKI